MFEKTCRIHLVDDHPLVREWLANLINQQDGLVVSGESRTAAEALEAFAVSPPDLAIVDISLDGSSGLDLIKTLKNAHPGIAVIVLSMHDEKLYAERAIRAGARGYVMKRESTKKVVAAIRRVLDGKLGLSDELTAFFAEKFADGPGPTDGMSVDQLSDRELEVFRLIGQGVDTRRVADQLHISIKTVQAYCARIKDKLRLSNATELLREAILWNESHP
jgi:DNA-binding NarL/FixJ family response regulator